MARDPDRRVGEAGTVRDRFEALELPIASCTGPELRVVAANAAFRSFVGNQAVVGGTIRELFPERIIALAERVRATGEPRAVRAWRIGESVLDLVIEPYRDTGGAVVGITCYAVDVGHRDMERGSRDVLTTLRASALPVLPSVQIASSYLLVDTDGAAGGDWFDAVPVSGGRVALVVGDVVGHGAPALAAMVQLRAVLRDRLDETGDVLAVVRAADRTARRVPGAHAATMCLALLDPDGTFTYCSAGHPPPLVVAADNARHLPVSGSGPLGTGADYTLTRDRVETGEMVLLYTDGIIEHPGREAATAIAELFRVAGDAIAEPGRSAVDRACTHALEHLARRTGHVDDVTVLAAQRRTPPPPVDLRLDMGRDTIGTARRALTRWLHDHDTGDTDVMVLAHAVTELVTNAVEHSHPDSPDGTVTVGATLSDDGEAHVQVADDGRWRHRGRPDDERFRADHGLGLAIATQLVDRLDIDRRADGTTATVHHRLSRPARLLTDLHRVPDVLPELMLILEQPGAPTSRVAVHGPVDATNADQLATELDRLTLGGTHPLTVDLTAVTHLASTAVAVLHTRRGLRLYAPVGSTAHRVLTLVGLPHDTLDPDL